MPSCQRKCLATGSLPRLRVSAQGFKKSLYGRVLSIGKYFSGKDTVGKYAKAPGKETNRLHSRLHRASLRLAGRFQE
jgi:hypothetical protein